MSSIISDIFYGSKQNILDNYLINRHEANQDISVPQKQSTVLYTSFIEFVIRLPSTKQVPQQLQATVEMGNLSDQNFIDLTQNQFHTPQTTLILNDLSNTDISKYTNIKITISEGKYKSKVHGFIPIQILKGIANSQGNEKTIIVQMKGKSSLGFSSIQCTIRTSFTNNNILNSNILDSIQKEQSSIAKNKNLHNISDLSKENSFLSRQRADILNKQTVPKRRGLNNGHNKQFSHHSNKSQNMYIQDQSFEQQNLIIVNKSNKSNGIQFIRQINNINIIINKITFLQHQIKKAISFGLKDETFSLHQNICLRNITRAGINFQVLEDNTKIGIFQLNALFLGLQHIHGEIPIYSQFQKCIGTVQIGSPVSRDSPAKSRSIESENIKEIAEKQQRSNFSAVISMNLDKIIFINSSSDTSNQSSDIIDPIKIQTFNFTKIQANNRVQIVVRLNGEIYKFQDIVIKYLVDQENIQIIEMRRKQGFFIRHFREKGGQLQIEIQIINSFRLMSYSKIVIGKDANFNHDFIIGDTGFSSCQCGIYLKSIALPTPANYFQQKKLKSIYVIMEDILVGSLKITNKQEEIIKTIMNKHKRITYVEVHKLISLLHPFQAKLQQFQGHELKNILGLDQLEINSFIAKFNYQLLRQFKYLDRHNMQIISQSEFQNILRFYEEEGSTYQNEQFVEIKRHVICKGNQVIYPFFIAGYYFKKHTLPQQLESIQNDQPIENKKNKQQINKKQEKQQLLKKIIILTPQLYYIQKITLKNVHLLNFGKVPNVSLSLIKKVAYSNSNPEFIIQKEVNLLEDIKIYHKSIVEDRNILLTELKLNRRQIHYELQPSGKGMATIVWGK